MLPFLVGDFGDVRVLATEDPDECLVDREERLRVTSCGLLNH